MLKVLRLATRILVSLLALLYKAVHYTSEMRPVGIVILSMINRTIG